MPLAECVIGIDMLEITSENSRIIFRGFGVNPENERVIITYVIYICLYIRAHGN